MKKIILIISVITAAGYFASCRDLKRNNPYDPAAENYVHVTYKDEARYPEGTQIRAMAFCGGFLYLGAVTGTAESCVVKLVDSPGPQYIGSTGSGPGLFQDISDMCADNAGNLYVTDSGPLIQIINPADSFSPAPISRIDTPIDKTYIEWLNNNVFVTSNISRTIYKYTEAGGFAGSLPLSFTAYGTFTPGRIFKVNQSLFVVNAEKQDVVVRMTENLAVTNTIVFGAAIMDAVDIGAESQALGEAAVFKVDDTFGITLKWGDFGEGPGKILNGRLAAYDAAEKLIFILDGGTIKIFGE